MNYLLDTDICIYILNGGNESLEKKFRQKAHQNICVSTITEAELYYGALHSAKPKINQERVEEFLQPFSKYDFDSKAALTFANIKEQLVKKGKKIGAMDMLIGAIALANQLVIVTNNTKHFQSIPTLKIENWTK